MTKKVISMHEWLEQKKLEREAANDNDPTPPKSPNPLGARQFLEQNLDLRKAA